MQDQSQKHFVSDKKRCYTPNMMFRCGIQSDFMQTKIQIADYDMYLLEDRPELADLPERPLHLLLSIFMSKDLWKVR